ncbi:hypothetical protein PVMG_00528 [Plasmodium vivax Mauritania I]|uniref:Uncharacterized protein n=1 Tax=Plasmodium vivax Mauritania I TaxID=1035515 RepID=A0A0J9T845_PLAVI|nr:hypothetical protein PVMG_00528 [Plasmodium vivax Mauritania I]
MSLRTPPRDSYFFKHYFGCLEKVEKKKSGEERSPQGHRAAAKCIYMHTHICTNKQTHAFFAMSPFLRRPRKSRSEVKSLRSDKRFKMKRQTDIQHV